MFRSRVECGTASRCVSDVKVSPGYSQLFLPRRRVICFPPGTPHEVSKVCGRHSIPMLNTVQHVGEDTQDCPVPLWWPKVKTRTDGPFRLYMLRVSAQDDRYSETGPPPNFGSFSTLSR